MDHPYLPVFFVFLLGAGFATVFLTLSALIGPKKKKDTEAKFMAYECGLNPIGTARERIDVKFSVIAMLFILFDIETVFFFPWAILYKEFISEGHGMFMLIEMGIFMVILGLGLLYVWRKGALDWGITRKPRRQL